MNETIAKLIALWLAGLSPDGSVPATFVSAYDADTIKAGFACTGPVTATITFEGLSMVQAPANAKPLTITIPCVRGAVPLEVRVAGIDTPELRGGCVGEKEKGLAARNAATKWLRAADVITLRDIDTTSEKWGRTLARVEFGTAEHQHDLGARLILGGHAHAYDGGKKQSWCGS